MRTISERLQAIADETGLKDAAIAQKTRGAITQQGVNKIRRGTTKDPSADTLAAIAKATGYRVEWLVSGRGPKTEKDTPEDQPLVAKQLSEREQRILLAGIREGLRQRGIDPDSPEFLRLAMAAFDKAQSDLAAQAENAG